MMAGVSRPPTIKEIDERILKPKYKDGSAKDRIRAYCEDIKHTTGTQITLGFTKSLRGSHFQKIRFDIYGDHGATLEAVQYIQGEFIVRQQVPTVRDDPVPLPRPQLPGLSGPRKAAQMLTEDQQQQLVGVDPDNPVLLSALTEENLRKHDKLTGTTQLRQFACQPCDNVWWRIVSSTKKVSRCMRKNCKTRYDALPREKEYGIGRFICQNCSRSFRARCQANTTCQCKDCNAEIKKPFIHPKFAANPNPKPKHKHSCDACHGMGRCPNYSRVIHASQVHDSTGSTASTFLTQLAEFEGDGAPYWDFTTGKPM